MNKPPTRGRPPKPPGTAATALLKTRLTAAELAAAQAKARAAGKTLSAYVRDRIR